MTWIAGTAVERGGPSAVGTFGIFLLPMLCIWFPETMGNYRGIVFGDRAPITESSLPGVLRFVAWIFLLSPLLIRFLIYIDSQ